MKTYYKHNFLWLRGDGDNEYVPEDRDDGVGDVLFNTLVKIVNDNDTSEWAIESFKYCATRLKERKRWPDEFSLPGDAPNWYTWRIHKFFGIKKYSYRSQDDITRDPYYALGYCYAHLLGSNVGGLYNQELTETFLSVTYPARLWRPEFGRWWRRLRKDNRKFFVRRLYAMAGYATWTLFSKRHEFWE